MRLNELTFPATMYGANEILLKAGYERIGKGAYGVVYYKDGDKSVLKLFETDDAGYTAFVALARQHQSNPYFPRFSRGTVKINAKYSAVRTEFLEPLNKTDSDFVTHVGNYITNKFYKIAFGNKPQKYVFDEAVAWLKTQPPALKEACDAMVAMFKGKPGYGPDIHSGNIMKRKRQLVFIDPFI